MERGCWIQKVNPESKRPIRSIDHRFANASSPGCIRVDGAIAPDFGDLEMIPKDFGDLRRVGVGEKHMDAPPFKLDRHIAETTLVVQRKAVLGVGGEVGGGGHGDVGGIEIDEIAFFGPIQQKGEVVLDQLRSEERRVGKECRARWSPYQ